MGGRVCPLSSKALCGGFPVAQSCPATIGKSLQGVGTGLLSPKSPCHVPSWRTKKCKKPRARKMCIGHLQALYGTPPSERDGN